MNPETTLTDLRAAVAAATTPAERAGALNQLAGELAQQSQYAESLAAATEAHAAAKEAGDGAAEADALRLQGVVHWRRGEYSTALPLLEESLTLFEELGNRSGVARATNNIGNVYLNLSEYPKALEYYSRALALHEELGERSGVALVTKNIGSLYSQKAFAGYDPTKAEELLQQAISLNEELGTKSQLYSAHQSLATLYEQENRFEEALTHFKKFQELYQEVQSEEAKKKATQVEQQRQIAEMEKRTAAERARAKATEELLHKTLPPTIADRMISGERQIADRFDSASILFADVVGFTPMTARMPASAVLEFMNFVFAHFDSIAAKHGCERIKTIGDGYMAACGAPIECSDHAERIARMAMEMLEDVALPASITEHLPPNTEFEIRIGLHSGSITGGVIGTGKLAYDIYGDTVNTASRMESHGEAGKIHVSEEFAEELRRSGADASSMILTERGVMEVKGKGAMRTYFLSTEKS
ncbi:MAG: tetratricopeptide repeat protein [Candidatus Kapabacteria bacterium]|nr:tetratricopeptide repeat protein [Candidatus Kapabacteria bacterium]